jgi:hypothetical protein
MKLTSDVCYHQDDSLREGEFLQVRLQGVQNESGPESSRDKGEAVKRLT